jgi:hypothetical protein
VAAPQCNGVSLSSLQTTATMSLSDGVCNACPSGSSLLQALMFSNVRSLLFHSVISHHDSYS